MTSSTKVCTECDFEGETAPNQKRCPKCNKRYALKLKRNVAAIHTLTPERTRYSCTSVLLVDGYPHRHYCRLENEHEDEHEYVCGRVWE